MQQNTDLIIDTITKYIPKELSRWELVGFLNKRKEIFAFGSDSKIIGRLFEVLAFDILYQTAEELGYILCESEKQTVYPDYFFIKPDGRKIAIDIKTTYRDDKKGWIKFTAGSFTSYLRNGTKNITGSYDEYDAHYILGVVYTRESKATKGMTPLDGLSDITAAYKDVEVFIQEKFRICGDKKGSGNTDNIGTIVATNIKPFIFGAGPFAFLGKEIFHDYWSNHPRYTDSKEIKASLYNDLLGYINWIGQKDDVKAQELIELYNKYLDEYKKEFLTTPYTTEK